jgi:hypothetical protein
MIDAPYTGIAHFLIPAREIIALTSGNDPKRAADQAYEQVGAAGLWGRNDPAKVITDDGDAQRLGAAVARYGDDSVASTLLQGRRAVYSPIDGAIALVSTRDPHDRVLIRPNNPLYHYFLESISNEPERTTNLAPATTVAAAPAAPQPVASGSSTVNAVF